ncbi:MAG: hypothetical protein D6734_03900 [Candidatus Schekmanbacteria bacterium]|nr:MAG: hypothetical protein D6734_03900 [Candidatus Schekmanbacteria bacterium]
MNGICPICKSQDASVNDIGNNYEVKCNICGDYQISRTAAHINLSKYAPPWQISAVTRIRHENGEVANLSTSNIRSLVDSIAIPSDPFEYIDKLIEYVFQKTSKVANTIQLRTSFDYPVICAENSKQFNYILEKALALGYLEKTQSNNFRLSLDGWKRIKELTKVRKDSKQAFVAMWFNQSMDKAWEHGIKPALKETGYKPIRIDLLEHNEKICDRIIAEIRKSGLLVADFTGHRGGVYFEAGFALGLGIPVIWTCKEDDKDNLHFDTRQYNHVIWKNALDLKQKLINRILASNLAPKN